MGRFVPASPDDPVAGGIPASADPGEWGDIIPAISEYLVLDHYDNGESRISATLLLFVQDSRWMVCLNDRERSRSAWASGATPMDALVALDQALQTGSASWRASGVGNAKGARRRGG